MFKRAMMALALVGMVASPALADLLVPDALITPQGSGGTIGIYAASVNGVAVASPGFLAGGVASQVTIPASVSDTIVVTFAFHWPFSTFYPAPYLGIQFQNRLIYDNREVEVIGATGATIGGVAWNAVNFGFGPSNSKMRANTSTATMSFGTGPLKGFPNPSSGTLAPAPGFGRFAVNPPTTTVLTGVPTAAGGTTYAGMFVPFSSTFPIMQVHLHVKKSVTGSAVDLIVPQTSAFLIFNLASTSTSMNTGTYGTVTTMTNTFIIDNRNFFTGSNVGAFTTGGGRGNFGANVIPEPASAALMGIGLFSLVGGFWRRRRRMSR